MKTDAKNELLLVVTTTAYPGWQATVDDKATPVYRVNGSFLAVRVPGGAHKVELSFRPARVIWWFWVSAVTLTALMIVCGVGLARRLWRA